MTLIEIGIYFFVLVVIPIVALAFALRSSKDKMYVIQPDGMSAKIGYYPLHLIDNSGHRIWIKRIEDRVIIETVHDIYELGKRKQIDANGHIITFTIEAENVIAHWNPKELSVHHPR